ncbi:YT521-B-like domain-containing protein [Bisporella sp. PMI_857]|nr:YT521-B-like domain-containing protein [Bisporella sp. PMI_857]KAH8600277.1 YT521-B-like domain-containing protein [Bisporella sp. PMI_857]
MLPPPVPSQPAPKSEIIASPSERGIKRPRSAECVEARPENKVPRAGNTRDSRQYDSYRARDVDRDFEDRGRSARYGRDGRDFSPDRIRPFESHGVYKGRAYDPNYATRGRARGGRARGDVAGRGDIQGPIDYDRDRDEGFGSRIANGQPYRDRKGFNRGGKGDTRYFIVKSFNEENVLKCIEDSIWTTQVQNGDIFAEAFKTCKNVILVFSINKSRAFQGYARMESVPGSVTPPDWQKAINWESAGAFRVRWIVVCSTRFHRIGHLKNALNDNQAVLIGKDGQEMRRIVPWALPNLLTRKQIWLWRTGDVEIEPGTIEILGPVLYTLCATTGSNSRQHRPRLALRLFACSR